MESRPDRSRYHEWVARKEASSAPVGLDDHGPLSDYLFLHQRDLVGWALRRGRAAVFADTGLGKTAIQLEWAKHVSLAAGRVLVLAPLAVAGQTVAEGRRFGVESVYARRDGGDAITITNYELLDHFDPSDFAGIVLDESSILKAYDGATRNAIIAAFQRTPFRLACTATPAPNDHTELGNHSEFLGIKTRAEMLAEYFVHDGGSTQNWRLKGHAEDVFWRWLCGWAAVVKRPSDLGHPDDGYILPELRFHEHIIQVSHEEAWSEGFLFAQDAITLNEQRASRRMTVGSRAAKAAELADNHDPAVVWCELNAEADAVEQAIQGAVQVRGSDDPEDKTRRLLGFASGEFRVLVTKPSIAGFGMNWQHCANVIFAGASHSYEQTYQAIRRCWRFGQKRPVDVHVIRAETERAIAANYRRKEEAADRLAVSMLQHVRSVQRESFRRSRREWDTYSAEQEMTVPAWAGEELA